MEQSRLRKQLDRLRDAGLDGVVFHPRFYPGVPPYLSSRFFEEVSDAIIHAKSIGMSFWLYDEDGWPSGTVGGQLLKRYPEHSQRWVGLFAQRQAECLREFEFEGQKWYLSERHGAGVDYLDPLLGQRFIEMTYERYRTGLSPEAFDHAEAFFCDEPEFGLGHVYDSLPPDGAIPWTSRLPDMYRARYQEDLIEVLPALFFPVEGHEEIRCRFWESLNDLFCDAFIAPLDAWCQRHGKLFTAHIKGEEHPLFQVPMVGSCHPIFRHLSLPGIDALERYPSNDFYPRQVSSAARQFGNGRCMVEANGGAGWGSGPEDLVRYLLWLGRHGLTDFVLHLSQYRLDSAAMHDWPPSQPLHMTWTPLYSEVLAHVRRELRARPRPQADTLVVAPYREMMSCYTPQELLQTNIHDAGTYPPTKAGIVNTRFLELIETLQRTGVRYDVTDERTLEEFGKSAGTTLELGKCTYERVIVAEGCHLRGGTHLLFQTRAFGSADATVTSRALPEAPWAPIPDGSSVSVALSWTLECPPTNCWLLEATADSDGWFSASFESRVASADHPRMDVFFADDIIQASLNGACLAVGFGEDGATVPLPAKKVRASNVLRFRLSRATARPFIWLRGAFRVESAAPFTEGPGATVKTEGPFTLGVNRVNLAHDLVKDGFPYLREPLRAVANVVFPRATAGIRLQGLVADAFRVKVDQRDYGWRWRGSSEDMLAGPFTAGNHRLQIEMVPSTYNACGPHHYFGGDWFVVSPGQIKGERNFADPDGSPEHTHVGAWHFRRFELPSLVALTG